MTKKNNEQYIIGIAIVIVVGFIFYNSLGSFAVLPNGEYNANLDCSFLTNAVFGVSGETIAIYSSSLVWIAVDANNDSLNEGYGYYGGLGSSGDACSNKSLVTITQSGLRVVIMEEGEDYIEVGICSSDGAQVYRYRNTDSNAANAILNCDSCTPNWECTAWTICDNSLQTRTCTDSNNCNISTNKPVESQSCSGGTCTPEEVVCLSTSTYKKCLSAGIWSGILTCSSGVWPSVECTSVCVSETCSSLNYVCGSVDDGCGNLLNCGTCGSGYSCSSGACVSISTCTPEEFLCLSSSTYKKCLSTGVWSGILTCSGGVCPSVECTPTLCDSMADNNCDGSTDRTEVGTYINKWLSNDVTRTELGTAIYRWILG